MNYYKGSIGAIIVYDITNSDSFKSIPTWLTDARNSIRKDASICLVGCKSDLKLKRTISLNEVSKFCIDNGLINNKILKVRINSF